MDQAFPPYSLPLRIRSGSAFGLHSIGQRALCGLLPRGHALGKAPGVELLKEPRPPVVTQAICLLPSEEDADGATPRIQGPGRIGFLNGSRLPAFVLRLQPRLRALSYM
uniref:Uncharacterized protein n=1 Tax=Eutreptiella gymnastica TaxID=73025 RepID=A0A7S4G3H7_9EUGL